MDWVRKNLGCCCRWVMATTSGALQTLRAPLRADRQCAFGWKDSLAPCLTFALFALSKEQSCTKVLKHKDSLSSVLHSVKSGLNGRLLHIAGQQIGHWIGHILLRKSPTTDQMWTVYKVSALSVRDQSNPCCEWKWNCHNYRWYLARERALRWITLTNLSYPQFRFTQIAI